MQYVVDFLEYFRFAEDDVEYLAGLEQSLHALKTRLILQARRRQMA